MPNERWQWKFRWSSHMPALLPSEPLSCLDSKQYQQLTICFWQCVDGYPYLSRCPSGLYFDDIQKFCTFKDEARCGPIAASKLFKFNFGFKVFRTQIISSGVACNGSPSGLGAALRYWRMSTALLLLFKGWHKYPQGSQRWRCKLKKRARKKFPEVTTKFIQKQKSSKVLPLPGIESVCKSLCWTWKQNSRFEKNSLYGF